MTTHREPVAGAGRQSRAYPGQARGTRVDLIYAMHVKPGDLYAGRYVPDAPTRPVQLNAAALSISAVTPFTDEAGIAMLRFTPAGELAGPWGSITPVRAVSQVFVIRTTP